MSEKGKEALRAVTEIINASDFSRIELLEFLVNLLYSIGSSIHGEELDPDQVTRLYYSEPSLGVALMAQAYTMALWVENAREKQGTEDSGTGDKTSESEEVLS